MNLIRFIKAFFVLLISLYFFFVLFNNIFFWEANFTYILNIIGMDSISSFASSQSWRSIKSELVVKIFFSIIIFFETIIFLFTLYGGIQMLKHLSKSSAIYNRKKKFAILGLTLSIFQWFFIFITIGGEWFLSYLSTNFNSKSASESLLIYMFLILIFITQKDE
ncbi:DUF2165 family protein [Aureivirga sp. CE67]|uniref:DUF2165 family protein n=1 Tax=Aureivirga sp. CE67 TaxID=1788983 RepID=UPI0018CAAEA5|nr:DUF2165 family protein [Aureivirga sp. CE67]